MADHHGAARGGRRRWAPVPTWAAAERHACSWAGRGWPSGRPTRRCRRGRSRGSTSASKGAHRGGRPGPGRWPRRGVQRPPGGRRPATGRSSARGCRGPARPRRPSPAGVGAGRCRPGGVEWGRAASGGRLPTGAWRSRSICSHPALDEMLVAEGWRLPDSGDLRLCKVAVGAKGVELTWAAQARAARAGGRCRQGGWIHRRRAPLADEVTSLRRSIDLGRFAGEKARARPAAGGRLRARGRSGRRHRRAADVPRQRARGAAGRTSLASPRRALRPRRVIRTRRLGRSSRRRMTRARVRSTRSAPALWWRPPRSCAGGLGCATTPGCCSSGRGHSTPTPSRRSKVWKRWPAKRPISRAWPRCSNGR